MQESTTRSQVRIRAEASRFSSFLLIGGTSTVLNLSIVFLLTHVLGWVYLPAALVAGELGMLFSFVLNDRLTFRTLAGNAGGWPMRCLRFHGSYVVGQGLTIAIAWSLTQIVPFMHTYPVVAQAIAIAIITVFNFGMLRVWAYRARQQPAQ